MHGGAAGSGAPRGNKNALKHGRYTRVAIEERQQLRAVTHSTDRVIGFCHHHIAAPFKGTAEGLNGFVL
jgi:hypothetical protein